MDKLSLEACGLSRILFSVESCVPDIIPPFTTVEVYRQTYLILYTNERLFPHLSQRCPLLYGICHCTEHNHFPTIVILSSSEQEKHSSGSGKLFFFLPPIFVFAFLRSYISIASLQYNSVTSVYRNILFFISCLSEKTQEKYSTSL